VHVGIIYPDQPNWPKMRWVHEALVALGHRVDRAHGADGFPRLSQECDVVILGHKGVSGRWPNLRDAFPLRKAFIVQWWFDLIAYQPGVLLSEQSYLSPDNHLPMLQEMDLVCVKERGLLDEFKALGINAAYLDQGCPKSIKPIQRQSEAQWDVLVWGQGGNAYPDRVRDAQALVDTGFRVAWASQGQQTPKGIDSLPWCHPDMLPDLCGRALCVLSCDRRHDLEAYWSDRLWMALGMGCCVLRRETPGLPDGPYVRYTHKSDLIQKVKQLLASASEGGPAPDWPSDVLRLGTEAREWCLEHHSIEQRCRQLLALVNVARAEALVA
jgi:hypothetical protein